MQVIFPRKISLRILLSACLFLANFPNSSAFAELDPALPVNIRAHDGEVTAVAISPDGRLLVSGGLDGKTKIWNVADGKELHVLGENLEVADVAFSPDGQSVVCAARNGRKNDVLQIWDYGKEKMRQEIEGHGQRINAVAYSPNGKMIASGSEDNTLRTWYASNGRDIQTYKAGKNDVLAVSWSPDSDYIAGGLSWDGNILVWDASRDTLTKTLAGHSDWVNAVVYSPDGRNIISGSRDGSIRIWDAGSGQEKSRGAAGEGIRGLAISGDGVYLAGATDNGVVVWYAADGKLLDVLAGSAGRSDGVAFSADGRLIAAGGRDGTIKIWPAPGAGNPAALFALAVKHDRGAGQIKEDKSEAFKWYRQAAAAGHLEAMARAGVMAGSGEGTAVNPPEAVKWLTAAAAKEHTGAMYALSHMYLAGKGVVADQGKAAALLAQAAAKGHVQAGLELSRKSDSLDPATVDRDSLAWLEKAAAAGDVKAMYDLGLVFRNGGNGIAKNSAQSLRWFMAAAQNGHAGAQFHYAEGMAGGDGVGQSMAEALTWYRKAAAQGKSEAMFRLAGIYATGDGVKRDHAAAAEWLKKAADQGHVAAKYRLAILYCTGQGVKQDYAKAVALWQEGSRKNDAMATFFLAYMYETGSGIKRDLDQAKKLYAIAAGQGNVFAGQAINSLTYHPPAGSAQ
jgi:hypothetical protein